MARLIDVSRFSTKSADTLTKQTVLKTLVDKIYLYKDGSVDIVWKD